MRPWRPGQKVAPMLLEKAHCIVTRFFGADQNIPVRIGGAVEFDDNGQRGLGWVLGWDFNQEIKIRKVFDSEILAREDCQRSKRIAAYMKPYEVLDTTVETVVRREQIIARKYVLTPDVWTKTMQLSKVHYKVVAVLGVKHTASTDQSDGEIPVIERTFHNLDCGTLQEV
jgi:hypothetical protein